MYFAFGVEIWERNAEIAFRPFHCFRKEEDEEEERAWVAKTGIMMWC